jgi:hypothetical protein
MSKTLPKKYLLNVVQFIQHPALLNDRSHSKTQLTVLKSLYGLPLNQEELEIYFKGTGKPYAPKEEREATFIAGRRAGKTSKLAAPIAVYEAFRDHGLPKNDEAFVMLVGPTMKQAAIALRHIKNYIRSSAVLAECIVSSTRNDLRLNNGVVISCFARTHDSIRGRTVILALLDEIAFWSDGAERGDSVEQVIDALRPGMVTARTAKLIKSSTPFEKVGLLWHDFSHRTQLNFPVWQLATAHMNPSISSDVLARELQRDEEKFRREFEAEFTDSITSWIASDLLDPCVVAGRTELPFQAGLIYAAALDPASRRNDFTLAILHKGPGETVVVDKIKRWSGKGNTPIPFEYVLADLSQLGTSESVKCF